MAWNMGGVNNRDKLGSVRFKRRLRWYSNLTGIPGSRRYPRLASLAVGIATDTAQDLTLTLVLLRPLA